jgi:hypothetical protein
MEGFLDLSSQLAVGADSVVLAVYMRGAPFWGALLILSLYISSVGVAIVLGSFIYCVYCNPSSAFLIYTYIFQTGFPLGGFIQGHVDQKYLCLQMHDLVS